MPRRLRLVVAYDGTDFVGWQRQKRGRTVQKTLEQALREILGRRVPVTGAGRTDSGVHAQGQAAHIEVASRMPPAELQRALNALLPADVSVRSVRPVGRRFHARYSAKSKWYRYTIWNDPVRPALERRQVAYISSPLDLRAMQRAAGLLRRARDFRAFGSRGSPIRRLKQLRIRKEGSRIFIDVRADGFLYHMVRRIAGFLIEAGRGRVTPIPPTAPAKGLCLMEVRYD